MTKTYKIGNKEISEADEGLYVSGNYLAGKINQLLEALSDKEEDYSYLDNLEQISHCCKTKIFFKGAGNGLWCSNCKKEVFHTEYKEEPKQEECDECDGSGFLLDHDGDYNTPCDSDRHKQSTSLKEEIQEFFDDSGYYHMGDFTVEKLIELIQSHLIKEVRRYNTPGEYIYTDDIIKIINNICHTQQD